MTARWWTGRALGFDLETDGKDPQDARIIQYATTYIAPRLAGPQTSTAIVAPERDIPEEASAVHGISTEHAKEVGISRDTAVHAIVSALEHHTGTDNAGVCSPIIGHNLSYDLTVLDREMRRTGIGSLGLSEGFALDRSQFDAAMVTVRRDGRTTAAFHAIDTLVLDKMIDRYRSGSRKLTAVADHYGVKIGDAGAHDASADVLASMRIAWRIAGLCAASSAHLFQRFADRRKPQEIVTAYTSIAHLDVAQMHARQVEAAVEQAKGLRAHFTRNPGKGNPAEVDGTWPLRPYI